MTITQSLPTWKKRRDDLDKAILGVRNLLGLPTAQKGNGVSSDVIPLTAAQALSALGDPNSNIVVSTDAYFGMNIVSAVQKYLGHRKKPATAVEIAAALEAGGLPSQSANFSNTVNSVITRNSQGSSPIFAKVKRGLWGLRAWYPNYRAKDSGKDVE